MPGGWSRDRFSWWIVAGLALLVCPACDEQGDDDDDTTDEPNPCDEGFVDDGGTCVPEHCGVGPWGDLVIGDGTVYVDAEAGSGGDGSADAPFAALQAGVDAAGAAGGGLVAVAAGTYVDGVVIDETHSGVHLAGRCLELVIVDGTDAGEDAIGVDVGGTFPGAEDLEISGLTVMGWSSGGLRINNGTATFRDLDLAANWLFGLKASASGVTLRVEDSVIRDNVIHPILAPSSGVHVVQGAEVTIVDSLVRNNAEAGFSVEGNGANVLLERVEIGDSQADAAGNWGNAIRIQSGASLEAVDCLLVNNREAAVRIGDNAAVTFRGGEIRETQPNGSGQFGRGIEVRDGGSLVAEDLVVADNHASGVMVWGEGAEALLDGAEIRGTVPDSLALSSKGVEVREGGTATMMDCLVEDNVGAGVGVRGGNPGVVSHLTMERVEIVGSQCDGGTTGFGLTAAERGEVIATDSTLRDNRETGVAAHGDGTVVLLDGVEILDTLPNEDGVLGRGINVEAGARVDLRDSLVEGGYNGGIVVVETGSEIRIEGSTVRAVAVGQEGAAACAAALGGGRLEASHTVFEDCGALGLAAFHADTQIDLEDVDIRGIAPLPDGVFGRGIEMSDEGELGGPALVATDLRIEDVAEIGLIIGGSGTTVTLTDSSIRRVRRGAAGTVAMGVVAEQFSTVDATNLTVEQVEGPGMWTDLGSAVTCTSCTLADNTFAGAGSWGGTLDLRSTTIEGTLPDNNQGGGVGLYVDDRNGQPTVHLQDSTIGPHPLAAVWIAAPGVFTLIDNDLTGGTGRDLSANVHVHGDAVFAEGGVTAWDDGAQTGLKVEGNVLRDCDGAGVFLHDATATLTGNTYVGNTTDLVQQACGAHDPPTGYAEAPVRELCPQYHYLTYPLEFELYLEEVEPIF